MLTVMQGYGALGRETARLLKAHGMRIIAANTSGKATEDNSVSRLLLLGRLRLKEQYQVPGTGDKEGALPDKYFSTKSADSLDAFLKECDVIVCTMPSTPQTRGMLNAKKLGTSCSCTLFIPKSHSYRRDRGCVGLIAEREES